MPTIHQLMPLLKRVLSKVVAITVLAASALAVASAPAAESATPSAQSITFRFVPVWREDRRLVEVEAAFNASADTTTELALPSQFGSGKALHRHITNLRVLTPGVVLSGGSDPATRTLSHEPGQLVRIAWEVVPESQAFDYKTFYQPRFEPAYLHLFGHAALVTPRHLEGRPLTLIIEWADVPPQWNLASSFGQKNATSSARWKVEDASLAVARHALFVAGDYRLCKETIRGRSLAIAVRGKWPFADQVFCGATRSVVEAHRAFWNDFDFPHFLISLSPSDVEKGSSGGTAVTNAFALHVSADFTVPGDSFDFLLGHEHLHTWVPARIGALPKEDLDPVAEAAHYWFSEGFTNFLTHRLLVKSGWWNLERYATQINGVISAYARSSARALDNAGLARAFWQDSAAQKLPYQRGELLALWWDEKLRTGKPTTPGINLDQVLVSLKAAPRGQQTAVERLLAGMKRQLQGIDADVKQFIEIGQGPEMGPATLGPCFTGRSEPLMFFDLGFDFEASRQAMVVKGLVAGSNAERAGLRDGQKFAGFSINFGEVKKPVEISVNDEGATTKLATITYLPARAGEGSVIQYTVKPNALRDAACRAWFGL